VDSHSLPPPDTPSQGSTVSSEQVVAAAEILRQGGLVAFPTETVYGLGADAENEAAVRKIFAAKGRPADHPVIVHLAEAQDIYQWSHQIPKAALRLADCYWPGPLTMILPRNQRGLDVVTGGQQTIGLRVPAHPVAQALLKEFSQGMARGIAAPSANRFGRISPTLAAHVRQELGDAVDLILDGGPSQVGLESTIVDLSGERAILLRPGAITVDQLEAVIGEPLGNHEECTTRASGRLASHYAPNAQVVIVEPTDLPRIIRELGDTKIRFVVLCDAQIAKAANVNQSHWYNLPADPVARARQLYIALRAADDAGYSTIVVVHERDPAGIDAAIWDRLQKAAAPR
jgi:L-threonylcarbamoyladenylate synthase